MNVLRYLLEAPVNPLQWFMNVVLITGFVQLTCLQYVVNEACAQLYTRRERNFTKTDCIKNLILENTRMLHSSI